MQNREIQKLKKLQTSAENYTQWKAISTQLEDALELNKWKFEECSSLFDYNEIQLRLDKLKELIERKDYIGLFFTLNEGIHGNIAGMGNSQLYEHTIFGTKKVIEDYVDAVCEALVFLYEHNDDLIGEERKLDFFSRVNHCFGRTAFMMSGGGQLLYFHVGVVKCLLEHDLLPDVISGSSGGAFVAAMIATRESDELIELFDAPKIAKSIIELGQSIGPETSKGDRALTQEDVADFLRAMVPDLTFEEAFDKTGIHINIPVAPAENYQTSHLLSAVTTPNVCIHESARASGSIPSLYPPMHLVAKDQNGSRKAYMKSRKWVDGSISDDIPTKKLARLYGVNHFIVSQINPHLVPFINHMKGKGKSQNIIMEASLKSTKVFLNAAHALFKPSIEKHEKLRSNANFLLSMANQNYFGDINIIPNYRLKPPVKLLSHPSEEEIGSLIRMGEEATWPKLEMIKTQTKISRTLQKILKELNIRT